MKRRASLLKFHSAVGRLARLPAGKRIKKESDASAGWQTFFQFFAHFSLTAE